MKNKWKVLTWLFKTSSDPIQSYQLQTKRELFQSLNNFHTMEKKNLRR